MKGVLMILITAALTMGSQMANGYSPYCGNGDGCYQVGEVSQNSQMDSRDISVNDAQGYIDADNAIFLNDQPYDIITEEQIRGQDVSDSYSHLPQHVQAPGERLFIFSPHLLRWAAYDAEGYLVASGKANGGASYCAELGRPCHTPVGVFRVQSRGDAYCISKRFPLGEGGAPMPYCMYFGGGYAIHGSPYISDNNTSHGCIRVHTPAAAWLHHYFLHPGTKVMVLPY